MGERVTDLISELERAEAGSRELSDDPLFYPWTGAASFGKKWAAGVIGAIKEKDVMDDCILELRFKRPFGKDTVISINLGLEHRLMPEYAEIMEGPIPRVGFDDAVKIMKRREISGKIVRDAAVRLGRQLAERLEDEAGWHGERRQENTKSLRET